MQIPIISFFTGAGFLDMGFEDAGFDVVWTNEFNPAFADMHEYAIARWRKSKNPEANAAFISNRKNIEELNAKDVINEAFEDTTPKLFGIIGGPPCPDFSVRGKNEGENGIHGKLSKTFIELIITIKPSFFVMENVPGLYRTKKHRPFFDCLRAQLEECGYLTSTKILNSLELGAPQDRERLFMIGFLKDFLSPTLTNEITIDDDWFIWPVPKYEHPKEKHWPKTDKFGGNPLKPDNIPIELTVYPLLFDDPKPTTLPNGTDVFNAYSKRFWHVDEGDTLKSSFKRLHRYRYSPTTCYGNNEVHLHPTEPRRLSVREALRIQTVPDEYALPANASLSHKFKMISNGVPYVMAQEVAKALLGFIESLKTNTETRLGEKRQNQQASGDYILCQNEHCAMSMR